MSDQKRRIWYVRFMDTIGERSCLVYDIDGQFFWPHKHLVLKKVEIPEEYQCFSLTDFINYFEHGIKPRRRVSCEKQDDKGGHPQEDQ